MSAVIATMMWEISGSLRCRTVLSRTCCRSVYVFMLCSCLLEADGSCLLSSASQLPYASAVHQSTYIIIIKAKIHYTSFLVASLQQVGDFPTTSPQHKWQVRNNWRGEKSVVSVVSCRFPNFIITNCCGLVGRVTNKSVTGRQLARLRGNYGETSVMDFGQYRTHRQHIL